MYTLLYDNNFKRQAKKIVKHNKELQIVIKNKLDLLRNDPKNPALKTHKVNTRNWGFCYSSRISGDLRIIWDFDEEDNLMILVLTIGGHSGKNKVYK